MKIVYSTAARLAFCVETIKSKGHTCVQDHPKLAIEKRFQRPYFQVVKIMVLRGGSSKKRTIAATKKLRATLDDSKTSFGLYLSSALSILARGRTFRNSQL